MTYESVMYIFKDYIASSEMIDVLNSKWGYLFAYVDMTFAQSSGMVDPEITLCETPEKLYDELKNSLIEDESAKIYAEKRRNKSDSEWDEDRELELASECAEEIINMYLAIREQELTSTDKKISLKTEIPIKEIKPIKHVSLEQFLKSMEEKTTNKAIE